jgi:hypothetical protein
MRLLLISKDLAIPLPELRTEFRCPWENPRSGPCSLEWGYGGPLVTLSGLLVVFYLNKNFK